LPFVEDDDDDDDDDEKRFLLQERLSECKCTSGARLPGSKK